MKIVLETSEGFGYVPRADRYIVVDTELIDPQIADRLVSLVQESRFFERPPQDAPPAAGAADYQTYTITVQDGSRVHTIRLRDPITDTTLQQLVSGIQTAPRTSVR